MTIVLHTNPALKWRFVHSNVTPSGGLPLDNPHDFVMTDTQRNLFEADLTPWEKDDQAERLVASLVFATGPPGLFDYVVPDVLVDDIELGRLVRAPFGRGNRMVDGYCVRLERKPIGFRRIKMLAKVVDDRSLLSASMLRLTEWIAEHYLCPWARVLEAVVPAGVRHRAGTRMATVLSLPNELQNNWEELRLPKKQAEVIRILASADGPIIASQLAKMAECTQSPIDSLRRKGHILASTQRIDSKPEARPSVKREEHLTLNDDQQLALNVIRRSLISKEHKTVLIHGVTGSGKTEVYIQAIQEVVKFGRQAIVLVPEISLTPQTVARFRSRFDRVAVLHSHLTNAQRHRHWQEIADGGVQVVVGARSAIFAPISNLGLIVLDEEHESTFKQETAPRYHARDVAIMRAKEDGVPLILGSATPSLESWHRTRTGEYELVEMSRRVANRPLPIVRTIDLRNQVHSKNSRGAISRQLHIAINEALRDGGQVILLLNRRGFSTHIQCQTCGDVVNCPECEIALTHHRTEQVALCHYCEYRIPAPSVCPSCGFAGIRYSGFGTQRLESEVKARFPGVSCLRMDTDSMQSRGSHEKSLAAFRSGKAQILLGTQMIAKGLDFPNVTLVGVINADTALHLPDFRAAERTFHLVTQVAGRTGRGEKGGQVLVQTFNPEHPAIVAAVRHDFSGFAEQELPVREMLKYPPFTGMVRFVVRGLQEEITGHFAEQVRDQLLLALDDLGTQAKLLGPSPAPFAKLKGRYRFHLQIQGPDCEKLRMAAHSVVSSIKPPEHVQWIVDVDPLSML